MGKRGPKPRDNILRKVCSFRLSEEEKVMTQIFSTLIHEPQRKRILKQVLLMLLQPVPVTTPQSATPTAPRLRKKRGKLAAAPDKGKKDTAVTDPETEVAASVSPAPEPKSMEKAKTVLPVSETSGPVLAEDAKEKLVLPVSPAAEVEMVDPADMVDFMTDLTPGQQEAFKYMMKGKNVFITGGAGTGKSYVLKKFIAAARAKEKQVLVCAPTGIAARNIGGITIHRAFKLPIGIIEHSAFNPKTYRTQLGKQLDVIDATDIVVIDEVSMMRIDVFEYVAKIIQQEAVKHKVRNPETNKLELKKHHIQLVVCGDFCQLPPIIGGREKEIWEKFWGTCNGFAFLSPLWQFQTIKLTDIIRQKDYQFATALNKIRLGDESGLDFINSHRSKKEIKNAVSLCATNKEADNINEDALRAIDEDTYFYQLQRRGEVKSADISLPTLLMLKVGCKVILLENNAEEGYYNGEFATVVELHYSNEDDSDSGSDRAVVKLENGRLATVKTRTVKIESYVTEERKDKDGKKTKVLKKVEVGSYSQLPMRLGYAITIHRSQGQTYDKVNLHLGGIFASGQLYVALSRCKSIENTYFHRKITQKQLYVDSTVKGFYERMERGL